MADNSQIRSPQPAIRNVEGPDAEELVGRLHALFEELEQYPEAEVRERALELVQLLLDLYGEALRRVVGTIDALQQRDQVLAHLLNDEVVRAILLVHGLVPGEMRDRVAAALERVRPYLVSQGCEVDLVGVEDGRARIRVIRSGKGAPPVAVLKDEIERSLLEVVPDLQGVEVEGLAEQVEATAKAAALLGSMVKPRGEATEQPARLVQIKRAQPAEDASLVWVPLVRSLGFDESKFMLVRHAEIDVLVCKVGGEFYAYRNACAAGGRALDDALFEPPMLTCACHGHRYDLRRGLCVERPELRLASLPAKVEDDKVKVALPRGE